jgi:hypothetical protein
MRFRFVFLLLLLLVPTARATTVVPPDFEELVAEADSIHRGRVTAVEARRVQSSTGASVIKTYVTFSVDRTLKGQPQKEIVLEFLGGTIGDETLEVGGMPHFTVGAREILFVQKNGVQFCPLVRLTHGRYRVERDDASGRDYVARENRVPLTDVAEVQSPMREAADGARATRSGVDRALSPDAFETRIVNEARRPRRPNLP